MVAFWPRRLAGFLIVLAGIFAGTFTAAASAGPAVVEVPMHGMIDQAMANLVTHSIKDAEQTHASAILIDLDSTAGVTAAAVQIRDALLGSAIPTIVYVSGHADGVAALDALSGTKLVMAPDASIGDAEPFPATTNSIAALRAEFESTAKLTHRRPLLAAAMVDSSIDVPEFKRTGSQLLLSTEDALRAQIAQASAVSVSDVLSQNHLRTASVQVAVPSALDRFANFATNPIVTALLLTIGLLGLLIEMQTLHGVGGTIGIAALAVFFAAHIIGGFSGGLVIGLALIGLLGILFELHFVPGHGAPGILGAIALFFSIVLAFGLGLFFVALQTVAVAIVLSIVLFALAIRLFPENAFMRRLTFAGVQGAEYVTSTDFSTLRGRIGSASSFLRPAGVALIDDQRVDVLTEGEFISAGTPVRVTRVQGARVFVEPL